MVPWTAEASGALPSSEGDRIRCVVWDLDNTLWDGMAVESPTKRLPEPRRWVLDAIDALAERGVLSSVASRTTPSVLQLLRDEPELSRRFVVPQVGWQDKSESVRRIAEELGLAYDSLLLVDDSPYERAEAGAMLPGVAALDPDEVPGLLAVLSPAASPVVGERVFRNRAERLRTEAGRRFAGSREEFLGSCAMRLTVGRANGRAELDRCGELVTRTHRLNAAGGGCGDGLSGAVEGGELLLVARLEDRFGDYGLIGAALVRPAEQVWRARMLALSCQVAGRGVALGFLRWLMDSAARSGAGEFEVDVRPTKANLELRLLFRQVGLRLADEFQTGARAGASAGGRNCAPARLSRPLDAPLLPSPEWLSVLERDGGESGLCGERGSGRDSSGE